MKVSLHNIPLSNQLRLETLIKEGKYEPTVLFEDLKDKINKSFRASGDCICPVCNEKYSNHPVNNDIFFYTEEWLNELCDGNLVHL